MRQLCFAILGGAILIGSLVPATTAWSQATSGAIKGEVVTTDDVPIEGATVRIESPSLMGIRQAETDEGGRFRFPNLPPGPYTLTAEKEGYKTLIRRGLVVETGRTVNLKLVLDLPEMGETVEIIDRRPTVDTEQTDVGETISSEFLGELPTGRSYQEVIQFLPGVTGGANPNVHGATDTSNQYYVDGVNTTDVVTNTFSMNFNFDAIQDIQVVTGAFDAKYGQALGGVINVTTKSGGNRFEGNFYTEYTTTALQSHDRYIAEDIQSVEAFELSASFGGPIVKDHLWFYIGYSLYMQDSLNLPALDTGRDLSMYPMLPRKWRSHYIFGKLTWQVSYVNKLAVSVAGNPTTIQNADQNVYTLPEAEYDWAQGGWYGNLVWDWTPSAYTVFRAQAYYQNSYIITTPVQWRDCTDWDDEIRRCNDESLNTTPIWAYGYGFNHGSNGTLYDDHRNNFTVAANFDAYFDALGSHTVSTGFALTFAWTKFAFEYYTNEVILASPPDYDEDGLYSDEELNAIDDYENVARYVVINMDPYSQSGREFSAYLQDVWKPWDNLTLRPGIRFDYGNMGNNLGQTILGFAAFSPRLNLAWDPANDRKTRISGGYNRYIDSGYLAISSFMNRTNFNAEYQTWDSDNNRWNTDGSRAATPTWDLMHYDLVPPTVNEYLVAFEREIQKDLSGQVMYIHRDYYNPFEDDEVNLIWSGDGLDAIGFRTGQDTVLYRMRTPGDAFRRYDAVEFTLAKNLSDNLQFLGSYTWSRTAGNTQGDFSSDLDVPWQRWYEDGLVAWDVPHSVKMQASYDNPGRIKVTDKFSIGYGFGAIFSMNSGYPYNKAYWNNYFESWTDLHQKRGSEYRLPAWSQLDLRGNIKFTILATTIELLVIAENALNSREITGVYTAATDSDGDILVDDNGESLFGKPYSRQFPRRFRFGLRVHF